MFLFTVLALVAVGFVAALNHCAYRLKRLPEYPTTNYTSETVGTHLVK